MAASFATPLRRRPRAVLRPGQRRNVGGVSRRCSGSCEKRTDRMDTANQQGRGPHLDIERIRAMIPHCDPFFVIDSVAEIVSDSSAVGIKKASINHPYFAPP